MVSLSRNFLSHYLIISLSSHVDALREAGSVGGKVEGVQPGARISSPGLEGVRKEEIASPKKESYP